jgi:ABC-type lipoprotein export system ATPase subunit
MNITAESLQKSYFLDRGLEVKALRSVSIEIKPGETVAIMGPSGAGKSTLLHLLGLMDRPTGGKLLIDGVDYAGLSDRKYSLTRREKVGFLFQMHYLLPDFTVLENVVLPVWDEPEQKRKKAKELLDKLGLSDRLEHMPGELSGGEQQRVAMARALVKDPAVVMADEPTGNLDRETGEKVEEILFNECKNRGISMVLVTHNPDLASKAGRIIKMRDGLIE